MGAIADWTAARALLLEHVPTRWAGGTSTFAEELDRLVVFARDEPGAGSLQAIGPAAQRLLDDPRGARVRQLLDGITRFADSRPNSQLTTLSILGSPHGAAPWGAMMELTHGGIPVGEAAARDATEAAARVSTVYPGTLGAAELAYIRPGGGNLVATSAATDITDLLTDSHASVVERATKLSDIGLWDAAARTRALEILDAPGGRLARERRWDQAQMLLHELEHATSEFGEAEIAQLRGLEEGTADALSTWPGAVERFATELGIVHEVERPAVLGANGFGGIVGGGTFERPYAGWQDGVEGYLELAGLDPRDPTHLAPARDVLRGGRLVDVPDRLAERMVAANAGAPAMAHEVLSSVIGTNEPTGVARTVYGDYLRGIA